MTPFLNKLTMMVGAMALWSTGAYANDDHDSYRGTDHHSDARYHDEGHNLSDNRYQNHGGGRSDHNGRYFYDDSGSHHRPAYRDWDHHYASRNSQVYPAYLRDYSNYPYPRSGVSFGISLGGNGYGHRSGHHGHY